MADIEAERAWLLQHGSRQRFEDAKSQTRQWAEEQAREGKTCAYCFHDTHVRDLGSANWSGSLGDPWTFSATQAIVFHCPITGCDCGVPPCRQCGRRCDRSFDTERGIERCPCGEAWQASVTA